MAGLNVELQKTEIGLLKEDFPHQCKVINGVGDFLNVVSIQPTGQNVVYKFQLNNMYPSSPPNIIIRSPSLQQQIIGELTSFLDQIAASQEGCGMLKTLVSAADSWLQDRKIDMLESRKLDRGSSKIDGKMSKKGKKMEKMKKLQEKVAKEGEDEKLSSMKTAGDVINRVQWDDNIPSDDVLVGYLDRFKGVVEKYFTAFSWEDLASVDYNVLAIPQHRIQYFKYRDVKIWDKNDRIDCVFGSTGSKLTITDIISKYKADDMKKQEAHGYDENGEENCNKDSDESDSDDDDDGINVIIGAESSLNQLHPEVEEDWTDQSNDFWQDKLRPNFFIAVRVTDKEIVKGVEDVQDFILEHEQRYTDCCIPPRALHITLCTLGLDTVEQKAHAVQVLQKMKKEIIGIIPKDTKLQVAGVDNFYSRVMFAKVQYPPQFMEFVDHIKLCLREEGIDIRDNHDFVPHMTIMKVSRPVSREMGTKNINPFLYSGFSDMHFGSQPVDNLHLCEMIDTRQDDGFYLTATSLEL